MNTTVLIHVVAAVALSVGTASAEYPGWQHSGSLCILTTPEGADLPATALEKEFPLLVRLDADWFDFSQAKTHGEDIRFSTSTGAPLAYQIEQWDASAGTASIWVRIPAIEGNAHQELTLHWGNTADRAYAFTVKLKPGLIKYKIEFGSKIGSAETVLHTATNLVCGDAYLIDGQSNALAVDWGKGG